MNRGIREVKLISEKHKFQKNNTDPMDKMDRYGILITLFFVIVGLFYPFCYSIISDPAHILIYSGALAISVLIGLLYVGSITLAFGKMAREKKQSN